MLTRMELFVVAIAAFILSLLGKWMADHLLSVPLLFSEFGLELSHNPGVAFGVRLPGIFQEIVIFAALIFVVWLASRPVHKSPLERCGFGLIIGGACANLVDRLFDGLVTDFIRIGSFPVFNVADSCITVGVLLLILAWSRRR